MDDLVNEMFLRLHKILDKEPSKTISDGYIYMILRTIFLNGIRDKRDYIIEGFVFESEDDGDDILTARKRISEELDKMTFVERETLLRTSEISLRELGKKCNVSYSTLHNQKQKYLTKLKKQINGKANDFKI